MLVLLFPDIGKKSMLAKVDKMFITIIWMTFEKR